MFLEGCGAALRSASPWGLISLGALHGSAAPHPTKQFIDCLHDAVDLLDIFFLRIVRFQRTIRASPPETFGRRLRQSAHHQNAG